MNNFKDFYEFYLTEHKNKVNITLHYLGTSVSFGLIIYFVFTRQYLYVLPSFLLGYVFAWVGHFVFEKNKPAAFKHPIKSFLSDLKLWMSITKKILKLNKS